MYTLYIKPGCPFCDRVLNIIEENGIEVDIKDTTDSAVAEELVAHGGKQQTPYLVDAERGTAMYESDDIISYLVARISGDATEGPDTDIDESTSSSSESEASGGGGE